MIRKGDWVLVDRAAEDVVVGDKYQDFRGDIHILEGGEPPQHSRSTGRIYTDKGSFYPGVLSMNWIEEKV